MTKKKVLCVALIIAFRNYNPLHFIIFRQLDVGVNPLSRITVASLEDMGYEVDYSSADPYGTDDLDPSCVCRRRRNLWDGEHGEVLMLETEKEDGRRALENEPLKEELRQYAIRAGQKILRESSVPKEPSGVASESSGDAIYVGDQQVSIFMRQGERIYGVIVTKDD